MPSTKNISSSRRRFLTNGFKLTVLGSLLLPLQKTLANGKTLITKTNRNINPFAFADKLVLNTKTKVVHLPTNKIFSSYSAIGNKNQKIINMTSWEAVVKPPLHFNKEKSGIILELLALQKLVTAVNDKTLAAAEKTLSVAFLPAYKNKDGSLINKFNFRLHELIMQSIVLNSSVSSSQRWTRFQMATGKINYSAEDKLPARMNWITNKEEFNMRTDYILKDKTTYIDRLKKRTSDFKL
ncbi:MAG TPA: hypothetical protein VKC90_13020 [Chitinophagaceae bacterium]|nr:hypothetical protein [Chitinophagaceae bacterium]